MPKKIFFESAVHQFVMATRELLGDLAERNDPRFARYETCVSTWRFDYKGPRQLLLSWKAPKAAEYLIEFSEAQFYTRGDTQDFIRKQEEHGLIAGKRDPISEENRAYFKRLAGEVLARAHEGA